LEHVVPLRDRSSLLADCNNGERDRERRDAIRPEVRTWPSPRTAAMNLATAFS